MLDLLILSSAFGPGAGLPSEFSYENLGKQKDKGLELGVDVMLTRDTSVFANYSYQAEPEPVGFPLSETNLPPTNRFNAGISYGGARVMGSVSVNYQDEAFWQDVLDARYNGTTEALTTVNGSIGAQVAWRQAGHVAQGEQPVQRGCALPHLRRRHQAAGGRRTPRPVLRLRAGDGLLAGCGLRATGWRAAGDGRRAEGGRRAAGGLRAAGYGLQAWRLTPSGSRCVGAPGARD